MEPFDENDDRYTPAERPAGDIPGGDRVIFERQGDVEQGIFGGSALDIEGGIWKNTEFSEMLLGRVIVRVGSKIGAMGAGTVQELTLQLETTRGEPAGTIVISGVGIKVERR